MVPTSKQKKGLYIRSDFRFSFLIHSGSLDTRKKELERTSAVPPGSARRVIVPVPQTGKLGEEGAGGVTGGLIREALGEIDGGLHLMLGLQCSKGEKKREREFEKGEGSKGLVERDEKKLASQSTG